MPRTTPKKQPTKAKKPTPSKQPVSELPARTRVLKQPEYKAFRLSKRIKHPGPKLPGSFRLGKEAIAYLWKYKRVFAVITIVYLLLHALFVRGFIFTTDLGSIRASFTELFSGAGGQIAGSLGVIGLFIGSMSPASDVAALYQSVLSILFSLFVIWTLRQLYSGEMPRIKDVFYKSTYPLIPFLIIIFVIGIQLLPLMLGTFLYGAAIASGLASNFMEIFAISLLVFLLVLWSLYMITSSLFAMYIVTLPDMTPLKALRSAKGLVQYRRWTIMRKLLFLPLMVFLLATIVLIPAVLIASALGEIVFLVGSALTLPFTHSYIYGLYRKLLV